MQGRIMYCTKLVRFSLFQNKALITSIEKNGYGENFQQYSQHNFPKTRLLWKVNLFTQILKFM